MKLTVVLTMTVAWLALPVFGQTPQGDNCRAKFAFVYVDRLDNTNRGLKEKDLKSVEGKLRKYSEICYTSDEVTADFVFFVHTKPAVYHGVKKISDTSTNTNSSPMNGTITDTDGNTANISGTVDTTTTTTTTTAVPYDVDYSVFILNVLVPQVKEGSTERTYRVLRTFDQKGLYSTIYGIGYGKGKHPIPNLIEAAAKWLHENNLGR